jgi:hypothetical protein
MLQALHVSLSVTTAARNITRSTGGAGQLFDIK